MDANSIIFIVVLFALLLAGIFFIPRWLIRRAARQVIKIFRENNAIDSKNAKTIDALGLTPPGMLERMMRRRDYKPSALTVLISAGIVKRTEDGKLYLSEEKLAESELERGTPYSR